MRGAGEVLFEFLRLGCTSFGGPTAHLGYFRERFVARLSWLSERDYADLVALCQFLPGPTSSQVGFALGLRRAGALGGLAAWLGFTAPSALLMLAVAGGLTFFDTAAGRALAHGLALVSAAIVAHALFGMARALCTDRLTAALAAASMALATFGGAAAPAAIALGGAAGLILTRSAETPLAPAHAAAGWGTAAALLVVFAALLIGLPLAAEASPALALVDAFYRSGALVFGGGHVVLPLLQGEAAAHAWMPADRFIAGYGAAQALPGPLFSFAAFVGAATATPLAGPIGGLIALGCIFLPGLLLTAAMLPVWTTLKARRGATGFVRGANAAVVGVLAAALYHPILTDAVRASPDAAVAAAGFVLLQAFRAPALLVVFAVAAAGAGLAFLR